MNRRTLWMLVATIFLAALVPQSVSARTVYERAVTLDVRLVDGDLIATGRVFVEDPAGQKCFERTLVFIRGHASGAPEWSTMKTTRTDRFGRFRIEIPLDSAWSQYRALVPRAKFHDVRRACARAVSPLAAWPPQPLTLKEPAKDTILGAETIFRVDVGNPAGVESVAFKMYPGGTTRACPRGEADHRVYEAPYEWNWKPQSAGSDVVLGVAAWGRDGFAYCRQWTFRVGDLGSLMWWGLDQGEARADLGADSSWFNTTTGLIPVTGHFDRDGRADIFWYSPSGPEMIWWARSKTFTETSSQSQVEAGLVPAVGDFDGNGIDDIIWYGAGTKTDVIWWGSDGRTWAVAHEPQMTGVWDQLVTGDYNGDGYDDIYFYANNAKTQACGNTQPQTYWWGKSSRSTLNSGATSALGSECYYRWLSGDFDGDTWDDFFAYGQYPNSRDAFAWRNPAVSARVSQPYGFEPFVGDFDGDGKDDIFWFAPGAADSQWWGPSRPAPGTTTVVRDESRVQVDGDFFPVSADFDGDNDDDILWYER
ncbi:MAG: VCBS repeat-containing protein [Actinomycetota bacterium]|nr:VCBS repeat-containing protein [Actinomycetota bacterium]